MKKGRKKYRRQDTGEDRTPPRYSTGGVEFPPEAIDDDRVPPQTKNGEDEILPEKKDDEQDLSLSKNDDERVPPNNKQVNNRRLPREPYGEVCKFKETESVNLFR